MNYCQKSWKHLCIITKHKIEVMKCCFKAGLYWQGIIHDLSKYSLYEFTEYAKYYNGKISPVDAAKQEKGYCFAWLHHRGRNPHHYEYWIDYLDDGGKPLIMPYKYAMEMVCDYIGAGKAYNPNGWTQLEPLKYWDQKKKTARIHPKLIDFFDEVFLDYAVNGDNTLKRNKTIKIYNDVVT